MEYSKYPQASTTLTIVDEFFSQAVLDKITKTKTAMTAMLSNPVVKMRMLSLRSNRCTSTACEDSMKGTSSSMGLLGRRRKLALRGEEVKRPIILVCR